MIDKENGVNSTDDGKTAVISEDSGAEKQEASGTKESKRGRGAPISALICVALASAVITFQLTSLFMKAKYEKELSDAQGGEYFDQALLIDDYVRQFYIGEIDEQALRQALAMAYIYALGDNYAYYYTAEEYEAQIEKLDGNAFGIGVRVTADDGGGILVLQVTAESPASVAGIMPGDIITGIDGTDIRAVNYSDAVAMISGAEGESVTLDIYRGGSPLTVTAVRTKYTMQSVDYRMYKNGEGAKKIGFIRVYEFNDAAANQFRDAVNALTASGAEALIFDMRNNPGGQLESVVSMLDLLLPEGKVARITDKDGNDVKVYESDAQCVSLPMAVLTNGATASAAELFTAALKDYGKAFTVGGKTFGKGTVQTILPLGDGAAFKFSYRYYSPPVSENYHGVGLTPDIELALPEGTEIYLLDDDTDIQIRAAAERLWAE